MTECLPAAGQPSRGPGDTPIVIPKRKVSPEEYAEIAQLAAPPIVYVPVHVHDIPLANEVNGHCSRCGEAERHFVTIDDRDYCESCSALVRLEEFHRIVTGERP